MSTFSHNGCDYEVDEDNILVDFDSWDENYAEGMAVKLGITGGLSQEHWEVINFIRETFKRTGRVPLVYETSIIKSINIKEGKRLFPCGYMRGACVLAGVSYRESYLKPAYLPQSAKDIDLNAVEKVYAVDVRGFLIDPSEWNEYFAIYRAFESRVPNGILTERHWQIIYYLRDQFAQSKRVPLVWETCEANNMTIKELEELFPNGYHRGAVKLAGLRVR